jgi:hypothetical protein
MNHNQNLLNVIFHGTFVFRRTARHYLEKGIEKVDARTEGIEVLIPFVATHRYRAGNWLGETTLEGGDGEALAIYELTGVEPGRAWLSDEHNLILRNRPLRRGVALHNRLHAKLLIPLPHSVVTPRRAPVGNNFNQKALLPRDYRGNVGTLQIFTYTFRSDAALKIAGNLKIGGKVHGHPWEPAFTGFGLSTVNLHVVAAHEHDEDADEVQTAFRNSMDLYNLPLRLRGTGIRGEIQVGELPAGVLPEECEDLHLRTRRMAQMGRMKKDGRDMNQLWFPSEAFDSEPGTCLQLGDRG